MGLVLLGKEERSKMRQTRVKNASKMRGTPLRENTFWTIPISRSLKNYQYSTEGAEFSRKLSTSTGNHFWEFSGIL